MNEVMQPGPELDAAVAERVMGWKPLPTQPRSGMAYPDRFKQRWMLPSGVTTRDLSRFSELWGEAGQVVERLVAKGFSVEVIEWPEGHECIIDARKQIDEDGFYCRGYQGESAPHAICLAALAATS